MSVIDKLDCMTVMGHERYILSFDFGLSFIVEQGSVQQIEVLEQNSAILKVLEFPCTEDIDD